MTIKVGDQIPTGTLAETTEFGDACPLGPSNIEVAEAMAGKKIAVFAVPGAFTPTCSAQHVPGYLTNLDALKAKGVDEVWCVAANDGFVMAAWGKDQGAIGRIRFLGDGSAKWAQALGLELDLIEHGMGMRMQRFSMLVDNGTISQLNIEAPGKFEISNAETLLDQLD